MQGWMPKICRFKFKVGKWWRLESDRHNLIAIWLQQDTFHPYCCSKEIIIEQMWISGLLQLKSDQILKTKSSSSVNYITQLQHVETHLLSCRFFFLLKLVLLHYRMILIRLLVYCRSRSGGSNLCSIFCRFKRKIWANGTNFEEHQIRQFFSHRQKSSWNHF